MSDERRDHNLMWVEVVGAVGATPVSYTCPTGCTARVVGAWGSKDEANARTCQWLLNDGTALHECSTVKTLTAVAERFSVYENGNLAEDLILHAGWSLAFSVAALAGTAKAFFHILVELRKGENAADGV